MLGIYFIKHEKAHCKIWLLTLLYLGKSTYTAIQHAAALVPLYPLYHTALQYSALQRCRFYCTDVDLQCSDVDEVLQ